MRKLHVSLEMQEQLRRFIAFGRHIGGEHFGRSSAEIPKQTRNALLKRGLIEGRRIAGGGQYYITEKGLRAIGINEPQRLSDAA